MFFQKAFPEGRQGCAACRYTSSSPTRGPLDARATSVRASAAVVAGLRSIPTVEAIELEPACRNACERILDCCCGLAAMRAVTEKLGVERGEPHKTIVPHEALQQNSAELPAVACMHTNAQ